MLPLYLLRDGTAVTGPLAGGNGNQIKFGAGAGPTRKVYLKAQNPCQPRFRSRKTNQTPLVSSSKPAQYLFSSSQIPSKTDQGKMCSSSPVKSLRSYAAAIFRGPVNQVDNDRYTVCWNCFVRNYKPHDGRCFNCGVSM
jgi:hypothetical protein